MARDPRRFAWLDERESGRSTATIARKYRVAQRTVQAEIGLALAEVSARVEELRRMPAPQLVPFFPVNGLFPASKCRHSVVPLPHGTVMCCAICHRSGMDGHPALRRFPRYDPRPDPVPKCQSGTAHATRRERRAKLSDHPGRAGKLQAA